MFDVISIGSIIRDIIFKTNESKIPTNGCEGIKHQPLICFRYGVKIDPDEVFFLFGGGGNNSAMSFAKLGLNTSIFSKVGDDGTGKLIVAHLKKNQINTNLIKIDKKLHTALSFIIVGKYGERTIFPYAGASGNMDLCQEDIKKLSKTKWIYLTTLRNKSQKILPKINLLVKKNNIKLAFNPGSTELERGFGYLKNILKNTEVLILNKEEAIQLISCCEIIKNKNPKFLLPILKKYGPKTIVITDGENGAWSLDSNIVYYIPACKGKIIEKTGAGDAFGSGFIAGLIMFNDIKKALILANTNSISVINDFGSCNGLIKKSQIKKIFKKYSNVKIREFKNKK